MLLLSALCFAGKTIVPDFLVELVSIGIPAHEREQAAWRINDLFVHNDQLFIGTGDAVINTGPTDIIYYDLKKGEYINEFTVDEEAIYRFEIINGQLMIPGTDATEDWSFGNIYMQTDTGWIKKRALPRALHVTSLISYQDRLYAGAITEVAIGESLRSYHGAVYMSADTGQTWDLLYLTPGDDNSVFHLDALVEFNGELYAFVYAHCGLKENRIPPEYRPSLGKPHKEYYQVINHDVLGTNDVLCYDGDRWSYKDIIPGTELARIIQPLVHKNSLVLPVIKGKYIDYLGSRDKLPEHAVTEIYVYDGVKTKKLKIDAEPIVKTRVRNDTLFVLLKQSYYYLAAITDPEKITYYQLPSKIGTLRSFEYINGVFYLGNVEGNIYKSISLAPIKDIQQQSECAPKKCHGFMSRDAIVESGWILMRERANPDSTAEIMAEIIGNNVLRINSRNLKEFELALPEYYLNPNKNVILLIDHDIAFDGSFRGGDKIACRLDPTGKWHGEIVHTTERN